MKDSPVERTHKKHHAFSMPSRTAFVEHHEPPEDPRLTVESNSRANGRQTANLESWDNYKSRGHRHASDKTLRPQDFAYTTPETNGVDQSIKSTTAQPANSRPKHSEADGADSEASVKAASTVWDELGELKSRIRTLEASGHTGGTTSGSNDRAERPLTGNTQTDSSGSSNALQAGYLSPTSPTFSGRGSTSAEVHPLLRSALLKCKAYADENTFASLQSSAHDALDLASLSKSMLAGFDNDAPNMPSSSPREIARRADNLCRSMTELCIAICENNTRRVPKSNGTPSDSQREEQTGRQKSPSGLMEHRRRLVERAEQLQSRAASRNYERSDSRRDSDGPDVTKSKSLSANGSSSRDAWTLKAMSPAKATGADVNNFRDSEEGDTDQSDQDNTLRVPSRTLTDVQKYAHQSHSPRDLRISRDYTSRHPLPEESALSPSTRQRLLNNSSPSTNSLVSNRTIKASDRRKDTDNDRDKFRERVTSRHTPSANSQRSSSNVGHSSPDGGRQSSLEPARRGSEGSSRLPPSTGANLAERLEARRQQRLASAGQLGSSQGSASKANLNSPINGRASAGAGDYNTRTRLPQRPGSRQGSASVGGIYSLAE